MIETFSDKDKLLVRYLFNELDKDEARDLEDEMLLDDELAKRAEVVEMNLIDCYVRNELNQAESLRFKEGYLIEPENKDKVERAKMFHQSLHKLHEKGPRVPVDRMRSVFSARQWPALVLVTTAMVLIAAVILFEIQRRAYNKNSLTINSFPPANQNAGPMRSSSVNGNPAPAPSHDDRVVELARNDPDKSTQYEYIHRQNRNGGERGSLIVSFVVGPQVKTLGLMYEFAGDEAARRETYSVRIKNQYGERIWPLDKTKAEIKPVIKNGKRPRLIVVAVPVKVFTDGGPYLFEFDDQYLPAKQFTLKR